VPVEVRDIIDLFPTAQTPFVVANLDALQPYLADQAAALPSSTRYELWLALAPAITGPELLDRLDLPPGTALPEVIGDAVALRAQYGRHLLARQIIGVFRLNVIVLIVLSFAALLMVQLLDGWRRLPSFGAMMSLGVSVRGIAGLIFLEGAALVVVGLAVGCLLGLALARLTLPLLTVTLSASLGGSTAAPLVFEWPELVGLMLAMAVLYLIGIALPAIAIGRLDVARRLRWRNA
jgi:hypothetical protein